MCKTIAPLVKYEDCHHERADHTRGISRELCAQVAAGLKPECQTYSYRPEHITSKHLRLVKKDIRRVPGSCPACVTGEDTQSTSSTSSTTDSKIIPASPRSEDMVAIDEEIWGELADLQPETNSQEEFIPETDYDGEVEDDDQGDSQDTFLPSTNEYDNEMPSKPRVRNVEREAAAVAKGKTTRMYDAPYPPSYLSSSSPSTSASDSDTGPEEDDEIVVSPAARTPSKRKSRIISDTEEEVETPTKRVRAAVRELTTGDLEGGGPSVADDDRKDLRDEEAQRGEVQVGGPSTRRILFRRSAAPSPQDENLHVEGAYDGDTSSSASTIPARR